MRRLYADISPGLGWNGREYDALEAATATSASTRTATLLTTGTDALALVPRPIMVLVGGTTPSHAPATLTITGTDPDDVAQTETITLRTNASGQRVAGATCGEKVFKTAAIDFAAGSGTDATTSLGFGLIPGTRDVRSRIDYPYLWEALGDRSSGSLALLDRVKVNERAIDISGMIDGKLGAPNGNYPVPFLLAYLGDLGRLALDLWVAEIGKAHPSVFVVDHAQIRKDAERELDMIRKALAGVGVKPPDPAANVGGKVGSIGANAPYVPPQSFSASLGDFA